MPLSSFRRMLPLVARATVVASLVLVASAAEAAFTTGKCIAEKRTTWINLRKCQGTEHVKQIKGKVTDLTKCDTKFREKLVRIDAKATKAGVPCRYRDNGDGTVTDFDTGLMWEQKTGEVGGVCFATPDAPHCVNVVFPFAATAPFVNEFLNGVGSNLEVIEFRFAGYFDWRLPTIFELMAIVDVTVPSCGFLNPCIDPVFGPTTLGGYWSATTYAADRDRAWVQYFDTGLTTRPKSDSFHVRAVRGAF